MGAMVPVMEGPKDWLVVDGPMGGECVAVDVVGREAAENLVAEVARMFESDDVHDVFIEGTELRDYLENGQVYEAEIIHGYCAYFTMPGCLDRTDNCGPHKTEEEAWEELANQFPEDFEPDYDRMTEDEFQAILKDLVTETMTVGELLGVPGVYEVLKEALNNEVLDKWAMDNPGKVRFTGGEEDEDR